ncbi:MULTISPECIES: hypothetical protein [unclassified Bradyrhizobium]|uniref:hypothetical protein n=1 Tax=unclassified Bradyrhizobium TaxID=2631580 RepID=UPI002478C560|nr:MULTISPECIES: hypothetical protein [unclassified Bradyrhizobium]WGS21027.1 hypothetical protein MTX22_04385 [Bradyrhizobium sp. ISRA463]WGS27939.1 hypothetical protein MTX19_02235 [Bradyrhizobium sp. ISRA464]
MFTYQTTDHKEARRLRIAQFSGRSATVHFGGATITGRVRSIVEGKGDVGTMWVITIIPEERTAAAPKTRPTPRMHIPAEDYL